MATHELKTDPEMFQAVAHQNKRFEIRLNDRNFKVGDILYLRETEETGEYYEKVEFPPRYTGNIIHCKVTYILQGPIYGLADDWCIMNIQVTNKMSGPADDDPKE